MADGEWQMANGKWRMANGEWRMADMARCVIAICDAICDDVRYDACAICDVRYATMCDVPFAICHLAICHLLSAIRYDSQRFLRL